MGTLKLDIWVVLNDGAKTMAKCPDTLFYVAGKEIILKYPILGTNFLNPIGPGGNAMFAANSMLAARKSGYTIS